MVLSKTSHFPRTGLSPANNVFMNHAQPAIASPTWGAAGLPGEQGFGGSLGSRYGWGPAAIVALLHR